MINPRANRIATVFKRLFALIRVNFALINSKERIKREMKIGERILGVGVTLASINVIVRNSINRYEVMNRIKTLGKWSR